MEKFTKEEIEEAFAQAEANLEFEELEEESEKVIKPNVLRKELKDERGY